MTHFDIKLDDGTSAVIDFSSEVEHAQLTELALRTTLGVLAKLATLSTKTSRSYTVKYVGAIVETSLAILKRALLTDKLVSEDFSMAVDDLLNSLKGDTKTDTG
jgi:hypothetical protein